MGGVGGRREIGGSDIIIFILKKVADKVKSVLKRKENFPVAYIAMPVYTVHWFARAGCQSKFLTQAREYLSSVAKERQESKAEK